MAVGTGAPPCRSARPSLEDALAALDRELVVAAAGHLHWLARQREERRKRLRLLACLGEAEHVALDTRAHGGDRAARDRAERAEERLGRLHRGEAALLRRLADAVAV